MEFVVNGRTMSLTRDEVNVRLNGVKPEIGQKHFVVINGQEYPVKQAYEVALGIDRDEFRSSRARSLFTRLGFTLIER